LPQLGGQVLHVGGGDHLLGRFLVVEQDIARLEVAMNNAPSMDVCYRLHQRGEEVLHLHHRQGTSVQALGQRTTGDIRCHQEEPALNLAKFKQGQNMVVFYDSRRLSKIMQGNVK
jgi:hypothetical protein